MPLIATSRLMFGLLLLVLAWIGCNDKSEPESVTEVYDGELYVDRGIDSVGGETVDTIFMIIRDRQYTIFHRTRKSRFCDSEGLITGFGRPTVILIPANTFGSGCDSLHIPQGEFSALFNSDGTVVMDRRDLSLGTVWQLRLYPLGQLSDSL